VGGSSEGRRQHLTMACSRHIEIVELVSSIQTQQNTQAIQTTARQAMLAENRELLFKQMVYAFFDSTTIDEKALAPDQLFSASAVAYGVIQV
jgi:hypothetical protein